MPSVDQYRAYLDKAALQRRTTDLVKDAAKCQAQEDYGHWVIVLEELRIVVGLLSEVALSEDAKRSELINAAAKAAQALRDGRRGDVAVGA
jgi:hypothetical protein